MESIGEKLAKARVAKGYSVEQIARDTRISQHYIEDIERERFDAFPGETYLLGFIRKYAGYLEMDPQEMVNLYRNQQLQEQPAPIEELLNPQPSTSRRFLTVGAIAAVVVILIGAVVLFSTGVLFLPASADPQGAADVPSRDGIVVHLSQHFLEQRFYIGDSIAIPVMGASHQIEIVDIDDEVWVRAAGSSVPLSFGSEAAIDVTGNQEHDIRVRVVDSEATAAGGVILRIDRTVDGPAATASRPGPEPAEDYSAPVGSTALDARRRDAVVVAEMSSMEPVQVRLESTGTAALVRLLSDDGTYLQQRLEDQGDIELEGERFVQLYTANAGAVRATVNGRTVDLGSEGEVRVVRFAWTNTQGSGSPRLEQIPVY